MYRGLYLRFEEGLEEANRRALALAEALLEDPPEGLLDAVPAYTSLYLEFKGPLDRLRHQIARLEERPRVDGAAFEEKEVEIPVLYEGEDLEEVALEAGLSPGEVIRLHTAPLYRVYTLGFTLGFPFMGWALSLPL